MGGGNLRSTPPPLPPPMGPQEWSTGRDNDLILCSKEIHLFLMWQQSTRKCKISNNNGSNIGNINFIPFVGKWTSTCYLLLADRRYRWRRIPWSWYNLLIDLREEIATMVFSILLCQTRPLASVVRRVNIVIYGINRYQVDGVVCFVDTYPLDSVFTLWITRACWSVKDWTGVFNLDLHFP